MGLGYHQFSALMSLEKLHNAGEAKFMSGVTLFPLETMALNARHTHIIISDNIINFKSGKYILLSPHHSRSPSYRTTTGLVVQSN